MKDLLLNPLSSFILPKLANLETSNVEQVVEAAKEALAQFASFPPPLIAITRGYLVDIGSSTWTATAQAAAFLMRLHPMDHAIALFEFDCINLAVAGEWSNGMYFRCWKSDKGVELSCSLSLPDVPEHRNQIIRGATSLRF